MYLEQSDITEPVKKRMKTNFAYVYQETPTDKERCDERNNEANQNRKIFTTVYQINKDKTNTQVFDNVDDVYEFVD